MGVGGGKEGMGGRAGDVCDGSGVGVSERRGVEGAGAGAGGWAGDGGGGGEGGGWIGRLAAVLVGEDPTQCYALICKNCHKHNGELVGFGAGRADAFSFYFFWKCLVREVGGWLSFTYLQ